ncbi:MAG: 4-alpha-glucanotransferase, partial [Rhodothermia bacterium]
RMPIDRPVTGVAVPVSSLRSKASCGIGEFLDLPLLGEWAAEAGLSLIQILPVNDTGTLSSPYSAVSAFALHPVYIRLDHVPGTESFQDEIEQFRSFAEDQERADHENVLGFKMGILYRTYRSTLNDELDRQLDGWVGENDWVRPYAVYKCLKDRYEQTSWVDWPEYRTPSESEVDALWNELFDFARFYAWIQMHLDAQFRLAVEDLHRSGVYLKGDIPILMNVDSTDVWVHRRFFNLDFGAGAPPDVFTRTGQTWGFPIYRWDTIESDGYAWWADRLQVAANYYDVYRIDHVIGFFRIWSQPALERTAMLGHYEPSSPVTTQMMGEAGLTPDEIRLLVEAWTTRADAFEALGEDADRVLETYFSTNDADSA